MKQIGNIYFIAAIAVIGGGLFGFDISSMSAIISTKPYWCQFNQQGNDPVTGECRGPDSNVQGGITAAMPGGSWLGAIISGFLSDRIGRKTSIQIGSIIWFVLPLAMIYLVVANANTSLYSGSLALSSAVPL
jgi:MFS family permease